MRTSTFLALVGAAPLTVGAADSKAQYLLAGDSLFGRRGLELHGLSGARIRIASPLLVVRGWTARFRHITTRILQVFPAFPADAGLGSRRALSVSSAAALCASHVGPPS